MESLQIRIVFMGTPDFAVEPLKRLYEGGYNIVGVITAPDKPAGRGKKILQSAVKQYAIENELKVLQPENLKSADFINELKELEPDLQVVVAFRMLPKEVWEIPNLGTFNLHASLLPQYRGAAPINWAIINGEKKTGNTTFLIDDKIDTGNILLQQEVAINDDMDAGQLHDELMVMGADLVIKTVNAIAEGTIKPVNQNELFAENIELKKAPKIFKEDCKINWKNNIHDIYNFIRGLSPYPAAYTEIICNNEIIILKIFTVKKLIEKHEFDIGMIITDSKNFIKIAVNGGFIEIVELQQAGKKKMKTLEFLNGFKHFEKCKL